jgi:hypothetical protein
MLSFTKPFPGPALAFGYRLPKVGKTEHRPLGPFLFNNKFPEHIQCIIGSNFNIASPVKP